MFVLCLPFDFKMDSIKYENTVCYLREKEYPLGPSKLEKCSLQKVARKKIILQ